MNDMRLDIFSTSKGPAALEMPRGLPPGEVADIIDWLELLLRRIKKQSTTPPVAEPT